MSRPLHSGNPHTCYPAEREQVYKSVSGLFTLTEKNGQMSAVSNNGEKKSKRNTNTLLEGHLVDLLTKTKDLQILHQIY